MLLTEIGTHRHRLPQTPARSYSVAGVRVGSAHPETDSTDRGPSCLDGREFPRHRGTHASDEAGVSTEEGKTARLVSVEFHHPQNVFIGKNLPNF